MRFAFVVVRNVTFLPSFVTCVTPIARLGIVRRNIKRFVLHVLFIFVVLTFHEKESVNGGIFDTIDRTNNWYERLRSIDSWSGIPASDEEWSEKPEVAHVTQKLNENVCSGKSNASKVWARVAMCKRSTRIGLQSITESTIFESVEIEILGRKDPRSAWITVVFIN
jgi:hypothetical protein